MTPDVLKSLKVPCNIKTVNKVIYNNHICFNFYVCLYKQSIYFYPIIIYHFLMFMYETSTQWQWFCLIYLYFMHTSNNWTLLNVTLVVFSLFVRQGCLTINICFPIHLTKPQPDISEGNTRPSNYACDLYANSTGSICLDTIQKL